MADREETKTGPVSAALLIADPGHPMLSAVREFAQRRGIALREIDVSTTDVASTTLTAESHWVLAIDDDRVAPWLCRACDGQAAVGLLPGAGSRLGRLFALPKAEDEQLELAFAATGVPIDITRCNDEPVLGLVAIGDVPFLDGRGHAFVRSQPTRWRAALGVYWSAAKRLFSIRPTSIAMQIGNEEKPRRSAVTGIVVLENDVDKLSGQLVGENLSARDGRLSAVLLAPSSVTAYLAALGRAVFGGGRLPRALSFAKTARLTIESEQPLAYVIDGKRRSATRIHFEVSPAAVTIKPGAAFVTENPTATDEHDTLRLKTLPENEQRLASIRRGLPLFTHALEDDFKDLFLLLRDSARVTPDYVVLTIASTLLAGLGLVLDSAAVIIGAMVLAPLMAPIVSLAMGALRRDTRLLQAALRTIVVGAALALVAAALLALATPLRRLTPEIEARLHPTLLDLGVAVVSGIAAAYAHARESVTKTLPGVAIAVALVPPLAVAGIGIGWADGRVVGGALLLFITNLVGIAATAALTFLVLGYAPIQTAARGLRVLALAVLVLALPLYWSFARIVETWRLESELQAAALSTGAQSIYLQELQLSIDGDTAVVRATVAAPELLAPQEMDALKAEIQRRLQRPVRLELELRVVR